MITNKQPLSMLALLALAILLTGCLESASTPSESLAVASQDTAMEHAAKHLDAKYVCPMHAQIVRDQPGSCPICGMDLVKKVIDAQAGKRPTVEISNAVINSMGVRTAPAAEQTLWRYIQTVGRIDYDETRLAHVHPRAEGWMEKLNLRIEGDPVKKGQVLGEIYSPEILNAQVDFLIALNQSAGKVRMEKARNQLRLLGVPEGTISLIQNRGESLNTVPLISPSSGVVTKLGMREGMFVKPDMEIVTIADLGKIWVLVDVYEHQMDWLSVGQSTEIRVPAYPGRMWEGRVQYIYPELDPRSRTLKVRLAFDNPDGLLKANMFAEVVIYGGPKREVLAVPSDAVIETGRRSSVVLALGQGRFRPVDVETGMASNGMVEILNGLKAGDEVVISGQFLIDSESSLQASFLRMAESEEPSATAADHQQ